MAKKTESVLLTIADKVEKSIREKNLHLEYPVILDFCRHKGVSSYTLHQIIEQELKRTESISDSECDTLGFVPIGRHQKPVKSESAVSPAKEPKKADEAAAPKPSKFKSFRKISGRIGVGVAVILFILAGIMFKKLSDKNSTYRTRLGDIQSELNDYKGFRFADWFSTNHSHASTDKQEYEFVVKKGDTLTADCHVDCEASNNDYLAVYITKGYNTGDVLLKLSGSDKSEKLSYTFPESGTYTLTLKYSKDASVSIGEDKAKVSNIYIKSRQIKNAKNIAEQ